MLSRSLKLIQVGYDCTMPNKPIGQERLSEPMRFVGTPTMHSRVEGIAKQRGVSFGVACRWAVDYWLAHGAPVPEPETLTQTEPEEVTP